MHERTTKPTRAEQEPTGEAPAEHERSTLRPRVYVASLADYNAGRLHGRWLDADAEPEELQEGISAMLAASREPVAEEWAIHDYELAGIRIGEYESVETISRLGKGLVRHGPAFAGLVDLVGTDVASSQTFEDRYIGCYSSVIDYAEEVLEACDAEHHLDQLPQSLRPYVKVDVEGLARDMQLGGEIAVHRDGDASHLFTTYD